jgi:hypothetical protein
MLKYVNKKRFRNVFIKIVKKRCETAFFCAARDIKLLIVKKNQTFLTI